MATQTAAVKEGLYAEGLKALLVESRRARRDGFTASELERVKTQTLRSYERAFEERDKTASSSYVREYVGNFLQDEPIPGLAEELRLARRFLSDITLDEVNRAGDNWITETNRVILFSAPAKEGRKTPTQQEILAVIKEAEATAIAAYDDGVSDAPLMAGVPKAGKIVSEKQHEDVETIEWTLSNGARVLLKPTTNKNDLIVMSAFSPGGHSLVSDQDYLSAAMASSIAGQSGLGAYDLIALRKKLAGKIAGVNASIGEQTEELSGSASPKDLETWFQLMHLRFTAPRADEKTFQSFLTRMKVGIENRERNPQVVYGDAISKALYGDHPRHRPMSLELLKEIDREKALHIYRERFANAGDFTFVFVGAFQPAQLRPLVETYLARLPALERKELGRHVGDDRARGKLSVEVKKGLEPKSSVNIMFHGDATWSVEERASLRAAVDVLRIRLRELLREDKGGVYGVSVYGDMTRRPKQTFSSGVSFTCSPDNVADLTQAALDEIKRLQTEGPAPENLEKVRETLLRNYEKGLKEDSFWLGNLVFYRENELSFGEILKSPERARALTPKKVQDAARKYFSAENVLVARLLPEEIKSASSTENKSAPAP
jgi:zinc protease